MKKYILLMCIILTVNISCKIDKKEDNNKIGNKSRDEIFNKKSIEFNNSGVKLFNEFSFDDDTVKLDSAILHFKKALNLDFHNKDARIHLIVALYHKKQHKERLRLVNDAIYLGDNLTYYLQIKAMIFRSMVEADSAQYYFEQTLKRSTQEIRGLKIQRILAIYYLKGKNEAIEEIDKLLSENGEQKEIFFDIKEMINNNELNIPF